MSDTYDAMTDGQLVAEVEGRGIVTWQFGSHAEPITTRQVLGMYCGSTNGIDNDPRAWLLAYLRATDAEEKAND
jgi:hypothetical protein